MRLLLFCEDEGDGQVTEADLGFASENCYKRKLH